MGKYEKKTPFWKKAGAVLGEILGELVITIVFFLIGAGVLFLLGSKEAIMDMDPDLTILLGALAVLALFGVIFTVASAIRKKKKRK